MRRTLHTGGTFIHSLFHAWNGLVHTVVHQRNMRLHVLAATLVSLVGSGIPLGLAEKVTLLFCVMLIFFAEMLNSALEQLVDLAIQQFDEKARLTKDTAAAGVLVLAIGTVVIFAALLVHNAETIKTRVDQIQRQVLVGVPLTVCAGVLMHESRRPAWVDMGVGLLALFLWGALLTWTESLVFSTMTLSLLVLCAAASHRRRAQRVPLT
ncbi:MAG: diacylglycerol kinase family protein [Myxococcota bacterium]